MQLNTRIEVVFSEPIALQSLAPEDFQLRASGGVPVPGDVGFGDEHQTVIVFVPRVDLASGTEYELFLGRGIRDREGSSLRTPETIRFRTFVFSAGFGAVRGTYRGDGGIYSATAYAPQPAYSGGWHAFVVASAPHHTLRYATQTTSGEYRFDNMPAGTWTIGFLGRHPWTGVFPDTRTYVDTALQVTVLRDGVVELPEMVLRPVPAYLIVSPETCPWGLPSPPTLEDWGNCDSGYWGGIDVRVEVRGIPGTATEGQYRTLDIASSRWSAEFHGLPPGEYAVHVAQTNTASPFRLAPWHVTPARVRIDRGLSFIEFHFWKPTTP